MKCVCVCVIYLVSDGLGILLIPYKSLQFWCRNMGIFELPQVGHACARAWWQDAAEQEASAGRFSLQNDGLRQQNAGMI